MSSRRGKAVSPRRPARHGRGREVGRIVLWCGITNLALVSLFVWNMEGRSAAFDRLARQASANIAAPDALVQSRTMRGDIEVPVRPAGKTKTGKRALPLTVVFAQTGSQSLSWLGQDPEKDLDASGTEVMGAEIVGPEGVPMASESGADTPAGTRVAPLLRRNPQSGRLEIGSFKAMTLDGGGQDCLSMGQSMLDELGAGDQPIDTLTETDQITITRICAANGSVILSCRNEQMTISPRRARPDDQCKRIS